MKKSILMFFSFIYITAAAQTCIQNSSSLTFDGFSQSVSFAGDNGLVFGDSITVEAWINASNWAATAAQGTIFCKHSWSNGEEGFVLRAGANGTLSFNIAGLDVNNVPVSWIEVASAPSSMLLGTWYHVAGTFDGTNLNLYINGTLAGTTAFQGSIVLPSSYPAAIGMISDQGNSFLGRYWDGMIDEVRVWHRALTQSEIQSKMNNHVDPANETGLVGYWQFNENTGTTLDDLTSNNNNGSVNSGQWTTQVPFTNGPAKPVISYSSPLLTSTPAPFYQWLFYNNPIPNATQQTHTATQTGVYLVVVSDSNGCSTSSDPYPVLTIGIDEPEQKLLSCYYSATTKQIIIDSNTTISQVILKDINGRIVKNIKTNLDRLKFNVADLQGSVYIIDIYSSGAHLMQKLAIGY